MAFFITIANGDWDAAATWDDGTLVPGVGDTVRIQHDVDVTADAAVGNGFGGGDETGAGLYMTDAGTLTISGIGTKLSIDSHAFLLGQVTMGEGTEIDFVNVGLSHYDQRKNSGGEGPLDTAHTLINGTTGNHCTFGSTLGTVYVEHKSTSDVHSGSQRFVATFCDFHDMGGGGFAAFTLNQDGRANDQPYSMVDCTFDSCYTIERRGGLSSEYDTTTGFIEFIRCVWTNPMETDSLRTISRDGMTFTVADCDLAGRLFATHTVGVDITDCVLRGGMFRYTTTPTTNRRGIFGTFSRNIVVTDNGGPPFRYGDQIVDCTFVSEATSDGNVHWHDGVGGDAGVCLFSGCVWQSMYTGTANGADGVFPQEALDGIQDDAKVRFFKCLLPLGMGGGLTATFSSDIYGESHHVEVEQCTSFTRTVGMVHVGETNTTAAESVRIFRSNLCVGSGTGDKMVEFAAGAEDDCVQAENVSHNGGYLLEDGAAFTDDNANGKGYPLFTHTIPDTDPQLIGLNDVDDEDPDFVDDTRTILSWDISLGGTGTLAEALDRMATNGASSVTDFIDYMKVGYAPQNTAYQATGFGGVDIGWVDVFEAPSGAKPGRMIL